MTLPHESNIEDRENTVFRNKNRTTSESYIHSEGRAHNAGRAMYLSTVSYCTKNFWVRLSQELISNPFFSFKSHNENYSSGSEIHAPLLLHHLLLETTAYLWEPSTPTSRTLHVDLIHGGRQRIAIPWAFFTLCFSSWHSWGETKNSFSV